MNGAQSAASYIVLLIAAVVLFGLALTLILTTGQLRERSTVGLWLLRSAAIAVAIVVLILSIAGMLAGNR